LKECLERLAQQIFGKVEIRWVDAHFPFTNPSFEMEIFFNGKWLEVLGCGVIHQTILNQCGLPNHKGWAFGLGLERLAMVRFGIPDIRLFWTSDPRFLNQFANHNQGDDLGAIQFQPYSKYPPCYKDISFWLPEVKPFHKNDFYEVVRGIAGDLVEEVELIDEFHNKKMGRTSHCYRINYRSMDRNLTNEEIDLIQSKVRTAVESQLSVQLR